MRARAKAKARVRDKEGQGQGKGGGKPGPQGPPKQPGPPKPSTPGKKQVEDGYAKGQKAEEQLPDKSASDPQAGAIDDYQKALQELEKLLKQLREEEMERLLAQLQQRCEYMLQMQKEVRDATVQIEDAVGKNRDKKPARADIQRSQGQADKEGEIAKEARKAKALVDAEGTAVAFSEIFGQLVRDMEDVQRRLAKADTGLVTVRIETDIIQMLEQMIEALKQAQKDMKNKPSQGGGQGGQSPAEAPGNGPRAEARQVPPAGHQQPHHRVPQAVPHGGAGRQTRHPEGSEEAG